jgi:hypothetical protein
LLFSACDVLTEVADAAMSTTGGSVPAGLTNDEVISGLKEALSVGIKNGADKASLTDGFLKNDLIKLPFPPDVIRVKEKLEGTSIGKAKVEEFEVGINRAAELASKEAAPIFINAIKEMSIGDGFTILKGADDAATTYLKQKTTAELTAKFSPIVQSAIDKVNVMSMWGKVTTAYNATTLLSGKDEVNTDLNQYITDKAISGLFTLVAAEELKIRDNPAARVTDILSKVFGSLDN